MGLSKYGNYDRHPVKVFEGLPGEAAEGFENVISKLRAALGSVNKTKKILCFDYYPGVTKETLFALAKGLSYDALIDMDEAAKSEEELENEFRDFITDDRVFGVMCHKNVDSLYSEEKLKALKEKLESITVGTVVVTGFGTRLLTRGDVNVYCSITRWEIQLRYRKGMPNWNHTNYGMPPLEKYKRGFFIGYRMADRYKKAYIDDVDFILETEDDNTPKLIGKRAYDAVMGRFSKEPFRTEPYFDPGVWGGTWMRDNFGLDKDQPNFAWSFDGVPEENAINARIDGVTVKLPSVDVVFKHPVSLLGNRVHARFGTEFPIRFDMLDTVGGGNLSLQVHPLTEYIQDTFGMHYTQDESYYILDTKDEEGGFVYLGLQKDVDRQKMAEDLRNSSKGEYPFPAENYVNKVPVKKHDHVLIPAGTVHCSGRDVMVLEISATPYIFTFKLWDWGRVGLDGRPRPIHVEHGLKNIRFERDTDFVCNELVHMERTLFEADGVKAERTGLHEREFIDTVRYTLEKPLEVEMKDTVHVVNLVDGRAAVIESTDGSFAPFEVHYAETVIVPASVGKYRIVPDDASVKMIVASVA
ncbi:MAG: class I mannose-6-phosphate isomerase [Lachnospiraceae bacterium]|nr:class I mannose-6-phosphate isomerase [Lachnospiraceae bacterium]